jgi:uncharacterized protein YlxW (UPF0749 family)
MTDQHEPERRTPADRGLPTAGRRPDPTADAPAEPDAADTPAEPDAADTTPDATAESPSAADRTGGAASTVPIERSGRPAAKPAPGDEPTVITPPGAATTLPGEERTLVTPWRGLPEDRTTRLSPPPAWPARPPAAAAADDDATVPRDRATAPPTTPAAQPSSGLPSSAQPSTAQPSTAQPSTAQPSAGRAGSLADVEPRREPSPEDARVGGDEPPRADDGGDTVRLHPPMIDSAGTDDAGPVTTSGERAATGTAAESPAVPASDEPAVASTPGEVAAADVGLARSSAAAPTAAASGDAGPGETRGAGPQVESLDVVKSGTGSATPSGVESPRVLENEVDLDSAKKKRLSSAGALIWVLLALFGFTLVVQLRSNSADDGLATARQEDLVRILSDLEARDQRLQTEIGTLETSQRTLTSGVEGRQAALAEAQKRADELGLLAGTLPGRGPGLQITIDPHGGKVKASAVLNAVQELRGSGGEVMEIVGANGTAVRIVASTYFVDGDTGGILVDGKPLTGPWTLWVIGVPETMQTALQIPGGVVASVNSDGGSVTMAPRSMVEVTAVRKATSLQYARPVS